MNDQNLEELRQRWEADPGSRVFLQLAEEYRRLGRINEAIHVLEQGLERSPNHLSAKVALGRCRLESQAFEAAGSIFEEVIERDPTQLVANRLLVEAYLGQQENAKAARRLDLYRLLNDSDPAIEELQARLDASASSEESTSAEAEDDRFFETDPEADEPLADLLGGSLPATESTASEDVAEGPVEDPEDEPFPELQGELTQRRYLEGLRSEGLFVTPEGDPSSGEPGSAPSEAIADEPTEFDPDDSAPVSEPPLDDDVFDLFPPVSVPTAAPDLLAELVGEEGPKDVAPEGEGPDMPLPAQAETPETVEQESARESLEELATVTLGNLYLEQGHREKAEEVFRKVLDREPDNGAAREGLAASCEDEEATETTAEGTAVFGAQDLLTQVPAAVGLTGRKIHVLRNYLRRIRREA